MLKDRPIFRNIGSACFLNEAIPGCATRNSFTRKGLQDDFRRKTELKAVCFAARVLGLKRRPKITSILGSVLSLFYLSLKLIVFYVQFCLATNFCCDINGEVCV
jgi:hypothetical protein